MGNKSNGGNRIHPITCFKRWTTSSLACWMIVSKFSMRQQALPFSNILFHQAPNHNFQRPINNFNLSICLWMMRGTKLKLSSQLLPRSSPKMTQKHWISVIIDAFRNAMKLDNFFEMQVINMSSIRSFVAWKEISDFRKSIYYHHNWIFTLLSSG